MSCCGKMRLALRAAAQAQRKAPEPPQPTLQNPVLLRHTGHFALVVKGLVTGQAYLFGPSGAPLAVDGRDATLLLDSGQFARSDGEA
jgi:hypothetical protein